MLSFAVASSTFIVGVVLIGVTHSRLFANAKPAQQLPNTTESAQPTPDESPAAETVTKQKETVFFAGIGKVTKNRPPAFSCIVTPPDAGFRESKENPLWTDRVAGDAGMDVVFVRRGL